MLDLNSEKNCFIEAHIDHSRTDYFDLSTLELHNVAWVISGKIKYYYIMNKNKYIEFLSGIN